MGTVKQQIRLCTTSDGVRVAYASSGMGSPLVKTASWLTHLERECTNPVWSHWLGAFSRHNRLVRYDPRGSGLSDREVDNVGLDAWVNDLEAVVDSAALRRFALLGDCQGCAVAVAYAARHPERVSRLVLYGGYAFGAYTDRADAAVREEAQALQKLIALGWGRSTPAFRQFFSTLLMPTAGTETLQAFTRLARDSTSPVNAARFWQAFHSFDVSELAPRVRMPTLVLHVRDDGMVPFEAGRTLASLIPDARFVPLDGANHVLLEYEPAWKRFLEETQAFLKEDEVKDDNDLLTAGLTRRELDILELVACGLTNDEIGERLFISPRTVRNHLTNIFGKLDVARRAQAIVRAREAGLRRQVLSAS